MMDNSTTFQGDGKVAYIPVVVNGKQTRRTNGDNFRAMSDEGLAKWLRNIRYSWTCVPRDNGSRCADFNDDCYACWLDWLRQECEE